MCTSLGPAHPARTAAAESHRTRGRWRGGTRHCGRRWCSNLSAVPWGGGGCWLYGLVLGRIYRKHRETSGNIRKPWFLTLTMEVCRFSLKANDWCKIWWNGMGWSQRDESQDPGWKPSIAFCLLIKTSLGSFPLGISDLFNLYRASTNQGIRDMKEMMSVLRPFWMNPRCYTFDLNVSSSQADPQKRTAWRHRVPGTGARMRTEGTTHHINI